MPPIQLLLTRRLLLAKQLLTETSLPVTEVAFASGFSSLRRFNDAFSTRYRMPPTRLRKKATEGARGDRRRQDVDAAALLSAALRLGRACSRFSPRARSTGIEWVTDESYARTVPLGDAKGWIRVTQSRRRSTRCCSSSRTRLTPALPALLGRVRALFDLNARPDMIAKHLRQGRAPRAGGEEQSRPARAWRVQRIRDGPARDPRAAGHREGGDDHRLPVRRGVRRAHRHAICRTESADARRRRASRRPASTTSPGSASWRLARGASSRWREAQGSGALCLEAARTQSGRLDQAPDRAARHRTVDGAIHRHARAALAGCVSRRKTSPCATTSAASVPRRRKSCRSVAAVAQLCGDARLAPRNPIKLDGHGQLGSRRDVGCGLVREYRPCFPCCPWLIDWRGCGGVRGISGRRCYNWREWLNRARPARRARRMRSSPPSASRIS